MANKTEGGDDINKSKTTTTTVGTKTKTSGSSGSGSGSNILTRSKAFKSLVDKVFTACDTSKSGDVSKSELYVGLLSVHITLARYAGPAACFPPSREVSDQLFEAADVDNSGGISKTEFENILMVLCAQILSRMMVYYGVLILFVPWFAKKAIHETNFTTTIPKGGYLEMAAEQIISISIFMLAIPLIWNAIDSKTEKTIIDQKINVDDNNNNNKNNNKPDDTDNKKDN